MRHFATQYCCVVWNPFLVKYTNAIEAVQRRFTKRIPSMNKKAVL